MSKELIKSGISCGITSAVSFAFSCHPEFAVAISSLVPAFVETADDYCSKMLSFFQAKRLKDAITSINDKINNHIDNCKKIRTDDFMTANNGEMAIQVMEGILHSIANEYENKKVEYYCNFLANLCFDERIVFEQALTVSRLIKNLSYRQLTIIAAAKEYKQLNTVGWEACFKDFKELAEYSDLYSDILELYFKGLLVQDCKGHMLGGAPFRTSELGNIIYDEVSLNDIPKDEVKVIYDSITKINRIINQE